MRYDRQIIGYHACAKEVADRLLGGDTFLPSSNEWDWLGSGVYFWEYAIRRGDCFLINRYCERIAKGGAPFDSVSGLFQEGDSLVAGSEIRLQSHIQIVVRRPDAIIGLFRPRGFTLGVPIAPARDVVQDGSHD